MTAVIAHLSDLHFGYAGYGQAWQTLKDFLVQSIRPDLVLVTGDLVSSPSKALFEEVEREIRSLGAEFLVCAGNHDRYRHGNKGPGWFRTLGTKHGAEFNRVFCGHVVSPDQSRFSEALQRRSWQVSVAGVDTSDKADYLARGWVDPLDRQRLTRALQKDDARSDLAIVMVHHHALPVRALEAAQHGTVGVHSLNATAMLNAASFLEELARWHVDLVLHGHEHAANWARYGSLEPGATESCVIGAGSGTGVRGLECVQDGASFNAFELRDDRSVVLTVHRHQNGGWRPEQEKLLRSPVQVRRARMLRHGRLRDRPDSEVSASFTFTRERDIEIVETRTNWVLEDTYVRTVRNNTGTPTEVELNVRGARASATPEVAFLPTGDDWQWQLAWEPPRDLVGPPVDLGLRVRWEGGALLTAREMRAMQERPDAGSIRREGLESVSLSPQSFVARLRIHLRLPREYAPSEVQVRVIPKRTGASPYATSDAEARQEGLELQRQLRQLNDSEWQLDVDYPRRDCQYMLAWPPVDEPTGAIGEAMAARLRAGGGERFVNGFRAALAGTEFADSRVSLYLKDPDREDLAQLRASAGGEMAPPAPGRTVDAGPGDGLVGDAFAGCVATSSPEVPFDPDAGEAWALALPVRFSMAWTNEPPWGVVRVSLGALSPATRALLEAEDQAPVYARFAGAMIQALAAGLG